MDEHPAGHKGTTHVIIITMLVALLALETATLGYVITTPRSAPSTSTSTPTNDQLPPANTADDDQTSGIPPLFSVSNASGESLLISTDRSTRKETTVYNPPDVGARMTIFAVPQTQYAGKIYLDFQGEGDNPGLNIQVLDVAKQTLSPLSFKDELPFVARGGATAVSPTQTKVAALYSNPEFDQSAYMQQVIFWDLATGQKKVIGSIGSGEYFSSRVGENTFAGAEGYDFSWTSDSCIVASIYKDGTDPSAPEKKFKESKTFCEK